MGKRCTRWCTYLIAKLLDFRSTRASVVHSWFSGCYLHCWVHTLSLQLHSPRNYCYWYCWCCCRCCCCYYCCCCYCSASRSAMKRWPSILHASNHCQNVNYPIACVDPQPSSPNRADAQSLDMLSLMNRTPGFQNKHTHRVHRHQQTDNTH